MGKRQCLRSHCRICFRNIDRCSRGEYHYSLRNKLFMLCLSLCDNKSYACYHGCLNGLHRRHDRFKLQRRHMVYRHGQYCIRFYIWLCYRYFIGDFDYYLYTCFGLSEYIYCSCNTCMQRNSNRWYNIGQRYGCVQRNAGDTQYIGQFSGLWFNLSVAAVNQRHYLDQYDGSQQPFVCLCPHSFRLFPVRG